MNEDNLSTAALRENLSAMVNMSNQFSEELRTLLAQYPAHKFSRSAAVLDVYKRQALEMVDSS